MTVPNVATWIAFKTRYDPRHHSWVRLHGVLPTGFVQRGRHERTNVLDSSTLVVVLWFERPAVEDLKSNQVEVNRMGIVREVQQVPDLHGIKSRGFRDRPAPMSIVEQHHYRIRRFIILF